METFMRTDKINISYAPLWVKLIEKNLKKSELREKTGIAASTFTKMGKNEYVSLEVLARIATALDCGIDDIVSIIK